jgi:hypothetical protein
MEELYDEDDFSNFDDDYSIYEQLWMEYEQNLEKSFNILEAEIEDYLFSQLINQ